MFGSDDNRKELVEDVNRNPLVKVDMGGDVVSFDSDEAHIDLEENIVRVEDFGDYFSPTKVHLPVKTMTAAENSIEKSEHYSFRVFDVRGYSKVVNTSERDVSKSNITLPYTEILFEY